VSVLETFTGKIEWENGLVAGYACEEYFDQAIIPIPEAMKKDSPPVLSIQSGRSVGQFWRNRNSFA
jgi:hypothetical protein